MNLLKKLSRITNRPIWNVVFRIIVTIILISAIVTQDNFWKTIAPILVITFLIIDTVYDIKVRKSKN
ncbi:hypothetical protein APT62_07940 [Aerococcus urinaeequi]|uniref:Uncharacterized protein n=1 Tax=Aerococcus urinaeequi TaxID=51665 RepID=A0AAC9F3Y8_9LACT|nr:hypothetical protein APT62_07940 [Aerococcus urinaeequi]AMB97850.1 hypothetical protein AWM74_06185 [Aerococcus urinaeequi]